MTLYDPPRSATLQSAYDVGWQAGPERAVRDHEHAALNAVATAVETKIAEALEDLSDSADEHVSRDDVLGAIRTLARELRSARQTKTGEIGTVTE